MTHAKVHNIAIDVGSGFTKVIADEQEFSFPSLVAPNPNEEVFQTTRPEKIVINDCVWIVGESCALMTKEGHRSNTLSDEWTGSPGWYALLYSSLAKAGLSGKINIITGIPQAFYANKEARDLVVQNLKGVHVLNYMDNEITVNIDNVYIIPQAAAAGLAIAGYDDSVIEQMIGVIDIGTYTTGFSVMQEGRFVGERSGGIALGISDLTKALGEFIESEFSQKPDAPQLTKILMRKSLMQRGQQVDISRNIASLSERIAGPIIEATRKIWGGGNDLRVIVSGGGAPYFLEAIKSHIFHAETIDDNFFAVSRGMFVYLDNKEAGRR